MTSPIADRVMAATHRLVQQAMTGQWSEVPRTLEERRVLLDKLTAAAKPQDQPWLNALQQAMAESDAAVARIRDAGTGDSGLGTGQSEAAASAPVAEAGSGLPDSMMEMIRGSR